MLIAYFAVQTYVTKLPKVFDELAANSNFLCPLGEKIEDTASPHLTADVQPSRRVNRQKALPSFFLVDGI
ncbi:hypothetical protein WJ63_20245 [Burkholderia pyrrocinia]|nr:hypothetical protein WJ63_20245 [Burkholderia pyrrocinia]